jgi:site-specific DNA recombinase
VEGTILKGAPQRGSRVPAETTDARRLLRAAIYPRVSSRGQLTDYDPDGLSLPAQQEACRRKAEAIGAEVVAEFVERAESARTAKRPAFREMMQRITEQRDIDVVIVHKLDRWARNMREDLNMYAEILDAGVRLVSVTEGIDESPSGMLLHGVLASVNEFYSRNLAAEVMKGLNQKARTGGTPGRAPIGYLNVRRVLEDGREVRTVAVDPERAPLVRLAFDLYATGDWSIGALTDALNDDYGLRTRPTAGRPSKKVAPSLIGAMLHNRYYIGEVSWGGTVYEGRHGLFIDRKTFDRVQMLLEDHAQSGEHRIKRHHYLKGSLFCASCGDRLVYGLSRGKTGAQYPYFSCVGRHKRSGCPNRTNFRAERLELAIEREYAVVERSLVVQDTERVIRALRDQFAELRATAETAAAQQRRRAAELKAQRHELLQLRYQKAIPLDLFCDEQTRITREIMATESLADSVMGEFQETEEVLAQAIEIGRSVEGAYLAASADPELRRRMNQLIFDRFEVEPDGAVEGRLAEPFGVVSSGRAVDIVKRIVSSVRQAVETTNPGHHFDGQGSNLLQMVGAAGFEPATSRV